MSYRLVFVVYLMWLLSTLMCFGQDPNDKVDEMHKNVLHSSFADSSLQVLEKAFEFATDAEYSKGIAINFNLRGEYFMKRREDIKAFVEFQKSIKWFQQLGERDFYNEYIALWNTATLLYRNKQYKNAVTFFDSASTVLNIYRQARPGQAQKDDVLSEISSVQYFRALCLKRSGQLGVAANGLLEALKIAELKDDKVFSQRVLNQVGLIKKDLGELDGAREYFEKVIRLNGNIKYTAQAYHNMGMSYVLEDDMALASDYLSKSISLVKRLLKDRNSPANQRQLFISHLDLGEVYFRQEKFKQAIAQWNTALDVYDDLKGRPDYFVVHNWLLKAYLELEANFEEAKLHNILYVEHSLEYIETRQKITDALNNSLFENQLANHQEVQANIKKTYSIFFYMVLTVALGATIWIVWYYVYKRGWLLYKGMKQIADES